MKYDERMEDYQKAVDLSTLKHTHTPMQCPYGKHPARPSAHMQTSKKKKKNGKTVIMLFIVFLFKSAQQFNIIAC